MVRVLLLIQPSSVLFKFCVSRFKDLSNMAVANRQGIHIDGYELVEIGESTSMNINTVGATMRIKQNKCVYY